MTFGGLHLPLGRQTVFAGHDGHGVALHRYDGHPLVLEPSPHHHVGAGQRVVVAGLPAAGSDVGAQRLELERRSGLGGRLRVDDSREWLVVDDDEFGGVDGRRPALGHHRGDHVPHEPDLALGQRRTGEVGVDHHETRGDGDVEIGGAEHADHTRHVRRLGHLDRPHLGMGQGRPDEDEMEDARNVEVVDERRPSEENVGVLDPPDGVAENRSGPAHAHRAYGAAAVT